MKITLFGNPIPNKRHRHTNRGSCVMTYDPQANIKQLAKQEIADQVQYLSTANPMETFKIANARVFDVEMTFYMPIPESDPRWKKNSKLWGFIVPNHKPDIDNLQKFYMDCGNGILWQDDAQIVDLKSKKIYSDKPRVEIDFMVKEQGKIDKKHQDVLLCFKDGKELEDFLFMCACIGASSNNPGLYALNSFFLNPLSQQIIDFVEKYADTIKNIKKKL